MDGNTFIGKNGLILVVDDDPTQRLLCREALEQRGYTVEEAEDGESGLDAARNIQPDLILLDVMMPGMDGYEVCREIRADADLNRTPVVIVTALEDLESIDTGFQAGASDFIGKPIVWPLLGYRLQFALRAAAMELDLVKARDEAEQASKAKSMLLANMGHELRTPLNAIIGFSGHLRDQAVANDWGAQEAEFLDDIHFSGHRLLTTVNDVLEMANLESGRVQLDETEIDLNRLVSDLETKYAAMVAEKSLTLDVRAALNSPKIVGDHNVIVRVLNNILLNAINFTDQGGVYVATIVRSNGELEISIPDTGIGMTEEDVVAIFEPFRQADTSLARKHEGTGLGVSITKALMALHGGRLEIQSEHGSGTTASIILPAKRVLGGETAASRETTPTTT
ncbi:MAG: hybrid sensor histidine kinase/response regulator [Alphaproteobacteria bacterium]